MTCTEFDLAEDNLNTKKRAQAGYSACSRLRTVIFGEVFFTPHYNMKITSSLFQEKTLER